MSGGSQNYLYRKVEEVVETLFDGNHHEISEEKKEKIKNIYQAMSKFMHDVEWVESGDCGCDKLEEALKQLKVEVNKAIKE